MSQVKKEVHTVAGDQISTTQYSDIERQTFSARDAYANSFQYTQDKDKIEAGAYWMPIF
jgi:hypothetical protein